MITNKIESDSDDEVKYEYKWLQEQFHDNTLFIFNEANQCKIAFLQNCKN